MGAEDVEKAVGVAAGEALAAEFDGFVATAKELESPLTRKAPSGAQRRKNAAAAAAGPPLVSRAQMPPKPSGRHKTVPFVAPKRAEEAVTHLQRVFWIRELVVRLLWRPGITHHELATVWQCAPKSVELATTEARNMIRIGFENPAEIREQLVANAAAIGAAAMVDKQYGVALKAGEAIARILGIDAPQRIELSGGLTGPVSKEDGERAMRAALGLPVPQPASATAPLPAGTP